MAERQANNAMQRNHDYEELESLCKKVAELQLASSLGVPFMQHFKPGIIFVKNSANAGWNNVNGLSCSVTGYSVTKKTTSCSSSNSHPLHAANFIFTYFEVTIDHTKRWWINIGLAPENFPTDHFVGNLPHSFAISNSGTLFRAGMDEDDFGPGGFTQGDTVGCGLLMAAVQREGVQNPRWIFFTKNGKFWGTPVALPLDVPSMLYPTVSIYEAGDKVTANFGTEPFKYPIPPADGLF